MHGDGPGQGSSTEAAVSPRPRRAAIEAALRRGRAWLAAVRNDDGSWGYQPGRGGAVEPTLLCAAAGMPLAASWLRGAPRDWASLLLPAAAWPQDPELGGQFVSWVLEQRSQHKHEARGFDSTIPAWSWHPGTAAWVEPTCYAVLSLRRAGLAEHPQTLDGLRMIADRQCRDGGWNYGNPVALDQELPGQLPYTGWAVMALPPGHEAVPAGLGFLDGALDAPSTLTLATAVLARRAHGLDAGGLVEPLAARVGEQGVRQRIDLTALALAALESVVGRHALV